MPDPESVNMDYLLVNTQLLIPETNEIKPRSDIYNTYLNPQLGVASQISLLGRLKDESDKIRITTSSNQNLLQSLQNELSKITDDIEKKKNEKIKLTSELQDMNLSRYINTANINMILQAMETNIIKDDQLKRQEEELLKKKKEVEDLLFLPKPSIPPVFIKEEQLRPISDKLTDLEKRLIEINNKTPDNICSSHSSMPKPQKDAFLYDYNQVNNPSYSWCVCNDKNKHSEDCIQYMDCNKNYLKNRDKEGLIGEDLTSYMKCISRYTNFPKYITENLNKNK